MIIMPKIFQYKIIRNIILLIMVGISAYMWTMNYQGSIFNCDKEIVNEVISFPPKSKENIHDCLDRSMDGVMYVICVKSASMYISKRIIEGRGWEVENINQVIKALNIYPEAVFLDLGSNIGTFSLVITAMNRSVVAVDAVYNNLAFISHSRKLHKEKYLDTGSIRLLYNAVSDHHERLYPTTPDETNPGQTFLKSEDQLQREAFKLSAPPVDSVTTLEILKWINAKQVIIKIDIEGMECQALLNEVLDKSSGTFIPYIFMEWKHVENGGFGKCPHHEELEERLYKNGYIPKTNIFGEQLPNNSKSWNLVDVIWVYQEKIKP